MPPSASATATGPRPADYCRPLNDHQIVAVGKTIHWSKKAKTFVDFLGEYIKHKIGGEWGKAELAKPLTERHPLMQWYDAYCRYQMATIQ